MKTRLNVKKFLLLLFAWFLFMVTTGYVPGFWGSILMGIPLGLIATETVEEGED